jgi:hypothetical protein
MLNANGSARALASCADRSPTGLAARYPRRAAAASQSRVAHDPCGPRALRYGQRQQISPARGRTARLSVLR